MATQVLTFGPDHRRLCLLAGRILGDAIEAEDAVQDAYLHAFEHEDQFEGRASHRTWLMRIVINEALGRIRRRRFVFFDDLTPNFVLAAGGGSPEQQAIRGERSRAVQDALESLPEKYRYPFHLKEVEGLSVDETARRLNVTTACLKTRLSRARFLLRRRLGRHHSWYSVPE